jgi:tetratricopeptide (TPR) repeat protein
LDTIDRDSLDAARQRARAVAKAWLGKWLAATPDAGFANLAASQVYTLDERYDVALTFLNRAESLGVEFELVENFAGRRLALFAQLGRYQDALWIADSLIGAGYFKPASILQNPLAQHDAAWVYNLNLLMGRFDGAEQVLKEFRDLVLQQNPMLDSARALQGTLCYLGCRTDITLPANFPEIPAAFRMTVLDSLLERLEQLPAEGLITAHVGVVVGSFFRNASEADIRRFSERLSKTASRFVKAGRTDVGLGLGIAVAGMDTTRERLEEVFGLLNDIVQREPDNLDAHYQIGKVGALTGEHLLVAERSLKLYLEREVPPEGSPHWAARWRLGMVYEHMGKIDEAREEYVKALELSPDQPQVKAALEKLMEGRD